MWPYMICGTPNGAPCEIAWLKKGLENEGLTFIEASKSPKWVLNQKWGFVYSPKMDGENNGSKPYEQMG